MLLFTKLDKAMQFSEITSSNNSRSTLNFKILSETYLNLSIFLVEVLKLSKVVSLSTLLFS